MQPQGVNRGNALFFFFFKEFLGFTEKMALSMAAVSQS